MIDIQLHLGADVQMINADPTQVEQIIMNLCINARDAMIDGGKLALTTADVTLDEHYCRKHLGTVPGRYACLTVADSGCGMDAQTLEHIFEPFYTTKEIGRGTGLGLSIVYGIVKNHGGYIGCQSTPGEGTAFEVFFPVAPVSHDEQKVDRLEPEVIKGGNEHILLVDDEELILEGYREVFEQYGYTVFTASRGEKALGVLAENPGAVDVVILDLNMPGMGGEKCFAKMREMRPEIKIIISSGYPVKGHLKRVLEADADGFISKPYLSKSILKKLREVLDA
jgi:two-component system cell cycle sensor histidine kinase/response regulator CckA